MPPATRRGWRKNDTTGTPAECTAPVSLPGRHLPSTADTRRSRLERAFRDIYIGTQHAFVSERVAMDAASVWLGIVDDQFSL